MKKTKRILSVLLALILMLSIAVMPVYAAGTRNTGAYTAYSPYASYGYPNCYCSFGDSISAGYDSVYNSGYYGYQPTPETAYPSIVAKVTNTIHCPFSFVGYRTTELLISLGIDENEHDYYTNLGYTWMFDENGECNYWDETIKECVKYSSLMTVNVGNNDILTAPLIIAAYETADSSAKYAEYESKIAELIEKGDAYKTAAEMLRIMNKLGYYSDYISAVLKQMYIGYNNLKENFPQIINQLRSVNTTGQIAVVGMYNPYKDMKLTDSGLINIGKVADSVVGLVNKFFKDNAEELGYIYVDVADTEAFTSIGGTDAHPTPAGHAYMARQILNAIPVVLPYSDVASDDWYYDSVSYCYKNTLMIGTSDTTFEPSQLMTRAMAATVIYRMDGSTTVEGENPFEDVDSDAWYSEAVNWAYQNGIISGVSDTSFDPDSNVKRQEFIAMLYRYAKYKGYVEEDSNSLLEQFGFKDTSDVAAYAKNAVKWALNNGILQGSGSSIDPLGRLTRAQCAAIISRFDNNLYI